MTIRVDAAVLWHDRAHRGRGCALHIMRVLLTFLCIALTGCGMQNMLRTSDDDCRDYYAGELKDSIDRAIRDEVAHDPPNGYKSKPYNPAQWEEYWNSRIYFIYNVGDGSCHGKYHGPSGNDLIAYILRERRVKGLAELVVEERNKDRVK